MNEGFSILICFLKGGVKNEIDFKIRNNGNCALTTSADLWK